MKFCCRSALSLAVFSAAAMGVSGCRKPETRVYVAPKDVTPDETTPTRAPADTSKPKPQLTYTLPAGWEKAPGNSVSLAAFKIKGGAGDATVTITPLPNLAGRDAMVINLMRGESGLPPIDEAELAKSLEPVEIAGDKGQMFELLGATEAGAPLRIVTAFVHKPDASWFYKLSGEDALVTAQKSAFLEFLKSVRVSDAPSQAASTAAGPKWKGSIPDGWQEIPPGEMQVAKFSVPEKDGAKAEVSVSVFPSDTGGTLANVNRWRKQLGLPEVDSAGLAGLVSPLDPAAAEAILVDLKNDARAMLGAIVPREGRWWFYKLMGDTPAVIAAREAFISFAKAQP